MPPRIIASSQAKFEFWPDPSANTGVLREVARNVAATQVDLMMLDRVMFTPVIDDFVSRAQTAYRPARSSDIHAYSSKDAYFS